MATRKTMLFQAMRQTLEQEARGRGLAVESKLGAELDRFKGRYNEVFNEIGRRLKGQTTELYDALLPVPNQHGIIETPDGTVVYPMVSKLLEHKDESRKGVILYVLCDKSLRIILAYTSLSQALWRIAPYGIWGRLFGKTSNENNLNLPLAFQSLLDTYLAQSSAQTRYRYEGSLDLTVLQPSAFTHEKEMRWTSVRHDGACEGTPSGRVIDPIKRSYSQLVEWPIHGLIRRVSFLSMDRCTRYHFLVSPFGFSLVAAEERTPFNKYGLRPVPGFATGLLSPVIEYDIQSQASLGRIDRNYEATDPEYLLEKMMQQIEGVRIVTPEVVRILHVAFKDVSMALGMTEIQVPLENRRLQGCIGQRLEEEVEKLGQKNKK